MGWSTSPRAKLRIFLICVVICVLTAFHLDFVIINRYVRGFTAFRRTRLNSISQELPHPSFYQEQVEAVYEDKKEKPPHIVFILADDLGWNDIGYHNPLIHTPYIDALSKEGVRLGNYYAQPNCSPSRAAFLTGKYSARNGVQHVFKPNRPVCLPIYHTLMSQRLGSYNYSTHLVGKWHLGYCNKSCLPHNRGFESFFGMLGGSNNLFTHHHASGPLDLFDKDTPLTGYKGQYSATIYTKRGLDIIADHAEGGSEKRPMFLLLSYQVPHTPQIVPKDYVTRWEDYAEIKSTTRRKYSGQVTCLDEAVKNVTETLKAYGMWNNTVLVFSSDNGGAVNYGGQNFPLRGHKREHFEGGVRVVGFIASPLLEDAVRGTTYNGLMGIVDWYPTFVEGLVGGKVTDLDLDGRNMWDGLRVGAESPHEDYILSVGEECSNLSYRNNSKYWDKTLSDPRSAIRSGKWKLIIKQDEKKPAKANADVLLFDLQNDQSEKENVASKYPDVVKKLRARIREYCTKRVPPATFIGYKGPPFRKLNGAFAPWGCTVR